MTMRGFAARLLLLMPIGLAASAVHAEDSIKIGLIEPFSGPIAAVGRDTLEGFEYYAGVVNERGGVLGGRMIEVVALDNAMNAEKTTQQQDEKRRKLGQGPREAGFIRRSFENADQQPGEQETLQTHAGHPQARAR